jgi:hypothetical protein
METYKSATQRAMAFEKLKELWFKQILAGDPPAGALRIALAIGFRINRNSLVAWPGFPRLMKEANVSRLTAIRSVRWLEQRKHISVARRKRGRDMNASNVYRITLAQRV